MQICVGIDAAKTTHWAVAIDGRGHVVLNRAVENNTAAVDALITELHGLGGEVTIGLDVVGSFARFLEAMLLAEGFALRHTPGMAVNRAGQGFAGGERKSDPRDAHTIAEPSLAGGFVVIDCQFIAMDGRHGRQRCKRVRRVCGSLD
jgi:hypothetical protein